jgi:hypothetical protein
MKPMVHYIPLKKGFSNFDEVIRMFRNAALRKELTDNAYTDLIASGLHTYKRFVQKNFDKVLLEAGLSPEIDPGEAERVSEILNKDIRYRRVRGIIKSPRHFQFPGRSFLVPLLKPFLRKLGQRREHKALGILDN